MGLFGSSKKIYVSSSVYNLAGDEIDRPNFLKTSLFSAVMNPYDAYLGEVIVGNYLSGPGIMQRSFFNWAVRNDIAGLPTLKVSNAITIDPDDIVPYIPLASIPVGLETRVQSAELTDGDFNYWAEQWLLENNPNEITTEWVSDYDSDTHQITIQYVGGSTSTFAAGTYNKDKKYVIARYHQVVPSSVEPIEIGVKTVGVYTTPSTTGYTLESTVNTGVVDFVLSKTQQVEKVYSDGSPTVNETTYPTVNESYNGTLKTWNRSDYVGSISGVDDTSSIEKWLKIWEFREKYNDTVGVTQTVVNDIGGGHTETVTTTTIGETLRPVFEYQEDIQETILDKIIGNGGIWIYEIGTGITELDLLVDEQANQNAPGYYPFIPIRINNQSITRPQYDSDTGSGLYAESKKAYKRATGGPARGGNLDQIIDEVEANPDIGDIDYCYVQWGVSVNVVDPACRRYMYEWFKNMIVYQNSSVSTMSDYLTKISNYEQSVTTMNNWKAAQLSISDPLFGTPKPPEPVIADPPSTTVRLVSNHPQLGGFDNRFTWVNMTESDHVGVGKLGAKPGDIWFENGSTSSWDVFSGVLSLFSFTQNLIPRQLDEMKLFKQVTTNTYTKITIWGMVHENYIYGGKAVRTTLREGVNDNAESVFIIPLHAPTVKSLGVKDFTQMCLSNTFLTFNSYLVVKKKWYETFLGMLFIIIVIVIVAVIVAPAAIGGASGILGTNAAVGASLGLTGTAAIVAGAVTNAIAAIIISRAISGVSNELFGEKWGPIIASIVSFAVNFGMTNGFSNFNLTNMMNPQVLLGLSSSLANGYAGFVSSEIDSINQEMIENQEKYEKSKKELENLMRSMGLTNDLLFNPMSLTDSVKGNEERGSGSYVPETLDQFISRTTMTGSDIVDVTLSMVSDYSDLQLTLPKS